MYRLEHSTKNNPSTQFVVVDDEHRVFAIGNTAACAWNVGTENIVTTHATAKEIKHLSDILLARGYQKYDAKSIDEMQEFRSIVQNN